MRGRLALAVVGIWLLTTGSSCQSSYYGNGFRAQGEGGGVVLVVLAAFAVSCLAYPEACGKRQPQPFDHVHETYRSGVDKLAKGDASGLELICLAGHQGYAKAQYDYGVYLFRQGPERYDESIAWLKRAAAQDHKAARHILYQTAGWTRTGADRPLARPLPVPPPAMRACARGTRPAYILEAAGSTNRQAG